VGKGKGHVPLRTCISCGSRRSKKELIRLVIDERGLLADDPRGERPGRGTYVCPLLSCVDSLDRPRKLKCGSKRKDVANVDDGFFEKIRSLLSKSR
jgi:predicted RNA-binding protein YlxR (DUF448 family)